MTNPSRVANRHLQARLLGLLPEEISRKDFNRFVKQLKSLYKPYKVYSFVNPSNTKICIAITTLLKQKVVVLRI